MCSRWATSARERPWRSRVRARTSPGVAGGGLSSWVSKLAPPLQFPELRGIGEAAPQLLHVAVLGHLVLVLAGETHAEDEGVERRLRELRIAQQVVLGILVGAALVGDDGEVVERADEVGTDQDRAA